MKRSFVVFGTLMIAALSFTSCNKNLKDDIKELKKQHETLSDKLNGISNLLGTDEPMKASTSFKDEGNNTRTISETYSFKSTGTTTQSMVKNENGTYDIYIARFFEVTGNDDESISLEFRYNPTTREITRKRAEHSWLDYDQYGNRAYFNYDNYNTGLTFNINLKNIDVNTGMLSLEATIDGTADYTNNVYWDYVPRQGSAVTTKISFDGKLRVFESVE